jgi:hypothetical protein
VGSFSMGSLSSTRGLNGSLTTYKYGFIAKMSHKKLACLENVTCSTFEIRMKFYHGQKIMIVILNVHHMYKSWGPQLESLTQNKPQQILVMWMDASPWWLSRCSKSRCGHRGSTSPIVDHIFLAPPNSLVNLILSEGKIEKTCSGESSCSRFNNLIGKSDWLTCIYQHLQSNLLGLGSWKNTRKWRVEGLYDKDHCVVIVDSC